MLMKRDGTEATDRPFVHTGDRSGCITIGGQERCDKAVEGLQGEVKDLAQKVQIVA